MARLDHYWYHQNAVSTLLAPVSWFFCALVAVRRLLFRLGLKRAVRVDVPVVVIGNITVGGTGKTPLVIAIAGWLREAGLTPGIISRGYGGTAQHWPQRVLVDSDPGQLGDEPVLIAQRTGCPVWVGPDRVNTARRLLADRPDVDVIISDDGMQHYRLERDIEIAVIDGRRRFGNGHCIPAGPLREPIRRLNGVDFVVVNGDSSAWPPRGQGMRLVMADYAISLVDPAQRLELTRFGGTPFHAVAGIGDPERFFGALRKKGMQPIVHAFSDHHRYKATELDFGDNLPIVMTEKDAVKCRAFTDPRHWYVPVEAHLSGEFRWSLLERIKCTKGDG